MVHRVIMLGRTPELHFRGMATSAGVAPDKRSRSTGLCKYTTPWRIAEEVKGNRSTNGKSCYSGTQRNPEPPTTTVGVELPAA
jgi:hypothetical protein